MYIFLWQYTSKIELVLFWSTENSGRLSVQAYTEIIKTISVFTNSLMKWESFFSPSRRRIRIIISYSYSCRQAGANDVRLLNNNDVGLFTKVHVDKTKTSYTCMCTYCHANQEWQWRNTLFTIAWLNNNVYTLLELTRIDRSLSLVY